MMQGEQWVRAVLDSGQLQLIGLVGVENKYKKQTKTNDWKQNTEID